MPHLISGALKDYDWGAVDGLAPWHNATGAPQAELWFGVHPSGPSLVVDGPDAGALLSEIPAYQGMPLVKLLAAAEPLSIQVHPDAETARRGWEAGSPLYADPHEKREMLVALEDFDVHAGWRDVDAAARALAGAGVPEGILEAVRSRDWPRAVQGLLALDPGICAMAVDRILEAAAEAGWDEGSLHALRRVRAAHPGDPGVLVAALLDHEVLPPGGALAVTAGVVHSYVSGLGIEVMTSSDNVLRLGLTAKPLAVTEAVACLRPDRRPARIAASADGRLAPDGMPFDLVLARGRCVDLPRGRHRLVLSLDGPARVTDAGGGDRVIPQGRALVWSPEEPDARLEECGLAAVVTGTGQLPG